jgi:hypothetical protein
MNPIRDIKSGYKCKRPKYVFINNILIESLESNKLFDTNIINIIQEYLKCDCVKENIDVGNKCVNCVKKELFDE